MTKLSFRKVIECPVFTTNKTLQEWRNNEESKICFVPTMGALHHGHGELIREATKFAERVLVSMYVNPLQFAADEDFKEYPRDVKRDSELAFQYGAHAIWRPSINEIFPNGIEKSFKITVPEFLKSNLCGSRRPGHFDGVAMILTHLLRILKPNILMLGEKDWQQFIIIKHLINDLGLPVELKGMATVREANGLALSSRNSYLNGLEREIATVLPKTLKKAAQDHSEGRLINLTKLQSTISASGLQLEYLEVVNPYTMQKVGIGKNLCLLAAAVRCGKTRLIDHTFLMQRKPIVAIDGPAGAGKSTVTKGFAKQLGLTYLDTGAMYRAVTWLIQKENIDPKNHLAIQKVLNHLELNLKNTNNGTQQVLVNNSDVTEAIRSPEVTALVSVVASEKPIREFLTSQQKKMGELGGLVAEGRDIGTTVFPNAELKVFLTASANERAKRRLNDLTTQGFPNPGLKKLEEEITARDKMDSTRKISPLLKADDAIEVITDGMNIDEVIKTLVELFRLKIPNEAWPTP